jgi:hypothetical protein
MICPLKELLECFPTPVLLLDARWQPQHLAQLAIPPQCDDQLPLVDTAVTTPVGPVEDASEVMLLMLHT